MELHQIAMKGYRAILSHSTQIRLVFFGLLLAYILTGMVVIFSGTAKAQVPAIIEYRVNDLEHKVHQYGETIDANRKDVDSLKVSIALQNAALLEVQKTLDKISALLFVLVPAVIAWLAQQLWSLALNMRRSPIP